MALAMFRMLNCFYGQDGRVVDFMGDDWRKTWGRLIARRDAAQRAGVTDQG